jgi:HD-GYP domain-containing protein (c-di-GMP phosphodiesterase class II)
MLLVLVIVLLARMNRFLLNTLATERKLSHELERTYDKTLEGWARALELRDIETAGHCHRVCEITKRLAGRIKMTNGDIAEMHRGSLLHDIGKMGIPDSILLKPGKLTSEEFRQMQEHTIYAYNLLAEIPYLSRALDIPYCHHEKWDGSGYPRRLREQEIPISARVFSVVDVYDALVSDRPYRPAWPEDKALAYIREKAGTEFDPAVVEAFIQLANEEMDELGNK